MPIAVRLYCQVPILKEPNIRPSGSKAPRGQIKVRFLCHKPQARKLLDNFGDMMARVHNILLADIESNAERFTRLTLNGQLHTGPVVSMLFMDPDSEHAEDPPVNDVRPDRLCVWLEYRVVHCRCNKLLRIGAWE